MPKCMEDCIVSVRGIYKKEEFQSISVVAVIEKNGELVIDNKCTEKLSLDEQDKALTEELSRYIAKQLEARVSPCDDPCTCQRKQIRDANKKYQDVEEDVLLEAHEVINPYFKPTGKNCHFRVSGKIDLTLRFTKGICIPIKKDKKITHDVVLPVGPMKKMPAPRKASKKR